MAEIICYRVSTVYIILCVHIIFLWGIQVSRHVFSVHLCLSGRKPPSVYRGDDSIANLKLRYVMFGERDAKQNKKRSGYNNNISRTSPFSSHSTFFSFFFPTGHVRARLINTRTRSRSRSMKSF